jgi:hypothetical protein
MYSLFPQARLIVPIVRDVEKELQKMSNITESVAFSI